jgi:tRNA(His) guanylyltransferase
MNPQDGLGDRLKNWEASFEHMAMKGLPLVARLDGRAFHTLTRNMRRPYDTRMQACMRAAAVTLLEDLHPNVAYTQSDEITVAWNIGSRSKSEYPFGGRIQKLASVLASIATEGFNRAFREEFHDSWYFDSIMNVEEPLATFDCRVFQVPSTDDLLDVFVWREDDAVKNSVTMLAQAHYSHKELHEKSTHDKLQMLESKGVVWGNEPTHFKRGIYLRRIPSARKLTSEELARIPEKHRTDLDGKVVMRSTISEMSTDSLRKLPRPFAITELGLFPKEE